MYKAKRSKHFWGKRNKSVADIEPSMASNHHNR